MWAGPAASPPRPRPSYQPPTLLLEGSGGGSEGHPPLATVPRPALRLPKLSALSGASEHQERKHRGCLRAPERWKGGPPATPPTGGGVSGVELRGSAPRAGARAHTSESAAPAGRRDSATLCKGTVSQSTACRTPALPFSPSLSIACPTSLLLPIFLTLLLQMAERVWGPGDGSANGTLPDGSKFDLISP